MTTTTLAEIRLRPRNQITLPAHIVRLANLKTGDRLTAAYANECIILTPVRSSMGSKENSEKIVR